MANTCKFKDRGEPIAPSWKDRETTGPEWAEPSPAEVEEIRSLLGFDSIL